MIERYFLALQAGSISDDRFGSRARNLTEHTCTLRTRRDFEEEADLVVELGGI